VTEVERSQADQGSERRERDANERVVREVDVLQMYQREGTLDERYQAIGADHEAREVRHSAHVQWLGELVVREVQLTQRRQRCNDGGGRDGLAHHTRLPARRDRVIGCIEALSRRYEWLID